MIRKMLVLGMAMSLGAVSAYAMPLQNPGTTGGTNTLTGTVTSVNKGTKTMVVKTADGTEQTIKWTDKTTAESAKATGMGVADTSADTSAATYDGAKEGTKVTVKYTEKDGAKTAVAVKDARRATVKAGGPSR
jgi:hypothetical protein